MRQSSISEYAYNHAHVYVLVEREFLRLAIYSLVKLYSYPPPPRARLKFSKNLRILVKIVRSVPRYYENGVVNACKCLIIILKIL